MKFLPVILATLGLGLASSHADPLDSDQKALFQRYPGLIFFLGRDYRPKNLILYQSEGNATPSAVKSIWEMGFPEEKGNHEAVTKAEEKRYGYSLKGNQMTMHSIPAKPFTLSYDAELGRPVAHVTLSGRKARLARLYVKFTYFVGAPVGVKYVDLHGYDLETGEAVTERVDN